MTLSRCRREDAERFIEEVRGDEPELAKELRIEERELEAGDIDQSYLEFMPCRDNWSRRILRFLRIERERKRGDWWVEESPPDAFVRELRRPRPSPRSGAVALELPQTD